MKHLQTLKLIEAVAKAGSIRKAAEDMHITSSALNRRILGFEEEFGAAIFERLHGGVRLNPAGELLIQHIRGHLADLERVRSQVADLSGLRRGHVSIACSQALQPYFMPAQIAAYRSEHPNVSFSIHVRDRDAAEEDLRAFESDLALVFEPVHIGDIDILLSVEQPVYAVMAKDHPLATKQTLRLRDCLGYAHVVPPKRIGIRYLLDQAVAKMSQKMEPIAEADSFEFMRHYVQHERAVGFQFPIGLNLEGDDRLAFRALPKQDVPYGTLALMQIRGRTLSVASARFANQLSAALSDLQAAPQGVQRTPSIGDTASGTL